METSCTEADVTAALRFATRQRLEGALKGAGAGTPADVVRDLAELWVIFTRRGDALSLSDLRILHTLAGAMFERVAHSPMHAQVAS